MSKRTQKDSGEERVTAKSKPMMNLVSRCSAKTPVVLSSTASESPVKTRHESQFPVSSRSEQHQRTGRPVEDAYSSSYPEWNIDKTWSSQEWKSDELMDDRTVRPIVCSQHTDRFIIGNDETVTNAWIDWYLTFITHVNINSIVMWIILQNNAFWDWNETPILREILRTQNLLRVEHCAFLEVIHLFQ